MQAAASAVQTKETLTLKASSFGSKCQLSTKFMDAVGKSGVAESILAFANFKQNNQLKKTDGAKRSRLTGSPPPRACGPSRVNACAALSQPCATMQACPSSTTRTRRAAKARTSARSSSPRVTPPRHSPSAASASWAATTTASSRFAASS